MSDGTDKIRRSVSTDPPRDQVRGNGASGNDTFSYKGQIEGFKTDNKSALTVWIDGSEVELNKLMQKTAVPIDQPAATRTPAPSDVTIFTGKAAQSRATVTSQELEDASEGSYGGPDYQLRGNVESTWDATLSVSVAVSFKSGNGVLLDSTSVAIYPLAPKEVWEFVIEGGYEVNEGDGVTASAQLSRVRELSFPDTPEYLEMGNSEYQSDGMVASSIKNTSDNPVIPYLITKWYTDANDLYAVTSGTPTGSIAPGQESPFRIDGDSEHFESASYKFYPYDGRGRIGPYLDAGYYRS